MVMVNFQITGQFIRCLNHEYWSFYNLIIYVHHSVNPRLGPGYSRFMTPKFKVKNNNDEQNNIESQIKNFNLITYSITSSKGRLHCFPRIKDYSISELTKPSSVLKQNIIIKPGLQNKSLSSNPSHQTQDATSAQMIFKG